MQQKTKETVKVIAVKEFKVGPRPGILAILRGDVRNVILDDKGMFSTTTVYGSRFGTCQLGRGWELHNDYLQAQCWWSRNTDTAFRLRISDKYFNGELPKFEDVLEKLVEIWKAEKDVKSDRQLAVGWWNNLAYSEQLVAMNRARFEKFRHASLTGREIEAIWKAEMSKELRDWEEDKGIKPNQKQFTKCSLELVSKYFDKFSKEDLENKILPLLKTKIKTI